MASIFKALGNVFSTISDSADAVNSGISNFREEQKADHEMEKLQRQTRILKETRKNLGEMKKQMNGISTEELAFVNEIFDKLGYSQLKNS